MLEELRLNWRLRLLNPVGIALILISVLLAVALAILPVLKPWSGRMGVVFLVGLIAYFATLAVVDPAVPALRKLRSIRRHLAARLAELAASPEAERNPEFQRVLAAAIRDLDGQILPTLQTVVRRHESLTKHLTKYEKGKLPPPDAVVFQRLRDIHLHQEDAIAKTVQSAANANAALLALTNETAEATVIKEATEWSATLLDIQQRLNAVLRGSTDYDHALALVDAGSENQVTVMELLDAASTQVESAVSMPNTSETNLSSLIPPSRGLPVGLSPREVEVLQLLAGGKTSKEIAAELVLSVSTVQRHVANIYNKIGARGKADAITWAIAHGLVPSPRP